MSRGSRAACANPNPGEPFSVAMFSEIVLGLLNSGFRWLKALKNSARNSKRFASVIGKALKIEISQFSKPGPRIMFRPASPNVPKTVLLANAQVLKSVPVTHRCPLGFPTTLGRDALKTNPPPSELERLVTMSVGVNQV